MTDMIKVNPKNPKKEKLKKASKILRNGGTVAFPTETVYGLGANALSKAAVKKVYDAKGRPSDNPMIVHVGCKKQVKKLTRKITKKQKILMDKFWPGPLTIVFEKSDIVPKVVTGGLDTVAIRMPSHPVALKLIEYAKVPLAAPSANSSGRPSPTLAKHVKDDLYGKVDIILDGGRADIGVESTVIDLTVSPPVLLRPGGTTFEDLKSVIKNLKLPSRKHTKNTPKSPGMKYRHYAPKAEVILVEGKKNSVEDKINELIEKYENKKCAVISVRKGTDYNSDLIKFIGPDTRTVARNLFGTLREMDKKGADMIFVEGVGEKDMGLAIMNRLRKSAAKTVKVK